MPLRDAILEAAVGRLRPVILTTVTTIAGLLPLTLGVADGGEFWIPLGIAIISGILVASTLTLFVVPVLYALVESSPEDQRERRFEPARARRTEESNTGLAARVGIGGRTDLEGATAPLGGSQPPSFDKRAWWNGN